MYLPLRTNSSPTLRSSDLAGKEGRRTLRANHLIVNGTVVADGLVTANPFTGTPPAVAGGTSGGGHGGIGGNGTDPAGGEAYGNTTPEPSSFEGSPGAGPDSSEERRVGKECVSMCRPQ